MNSWGMLAQKLRVPVGTLIGILFLVLMHPSRRSLWIGGCLALAGSLIRVWSAGHIEKGRVLAQGGPYSLTRNPLYLGSLVMALGVLLAGQGYWLLIPFGIFFALVYYPVMKREELELRQGHGPSFDDYSRRVPLFLPNFRAQDAPPSRFSWARVVKNREHRTVLGLAAVMAFLYWRSL